MCKFFIRQLAHAEEMILSEKLRGKLTTLYYQNQTNAAEALHVYHRSHL